MNNYRRNSKPHSRLLPYATIRAASEGDPDAVNAVLRHYEGYITRLAMRQLHDEGSCVLWVRRVNLKFNYFVCWFERGGLGSLV